MLPILYNPFTTLADAAEAVEARDALDEPLDEPLVETAEGSSSAGGRKATCNQCGLVFDAGQKGPLPKLCAVHWKQKPWN